MTLFSIGHSNISIEEFIALLRGANVEVVADVRTRPSSRFTPHFSRVQLQRALKSAGIRYVFLGGELGGRPSEPSLYDQDRHVRYDLVAATPEFQAALERLISGARDYRVAVMCGEEDPTSCHRRRLVGRAAEERGVSMMHIRGDGSLESEAEIERREAVAFPGRFQLSLIDPPIWRSIHPVPADDDRHP
jgi:uncharacterized protein (DUF488 family)